MVAVILKRFETPDETRIMAKAQSSSPGSFTVRDLVALRGFNQAQPPGLRDSHE